MNFIKEQFKITNRYIKENILRIFWVLLSVFIIVGILSYFAVLLIPVDGMKEVFGEIQQLIDVEAMTTEDGGISALKLFINNARASLVTYLYGFIPFLFLPVMSMILNSAVVGATMGIVGVLSTENVFIMLLKYILPHGIFEIPALLLAGAAGTKLCFIICKKIFARAKEEKISYHFKGFIRVYLCYIIPLMIVAAFIEAVVVPAVFGI